MTRTFIFAGGGTGGHLYPGLAIAERLKALGREHAVPVRCVFVCSNRPLDSQILRKEHAEYSPSAAQPLGLRPRTLIRFCRGWGKAIREARDLIRREQDAAGAPPHIVAMGGFVAAPVVQGARVENAPVTLVNLDAIPGKANRWIARRVSRTFTAARVADSPNFARTWIEVPPIVREKAKAVGSRAECRARLGLDPDRPTLMVTGGSQGAKSINDLLAALCSSEHARALLDDSKANGRWQVLHQTGPDPSFANPYAALGITAIVTPFVDTMSDWWGAADLAICRAGAGNVAEVWANHVPTIFLPYPFHKDQHQRFNAAVLADPSATPSSSPTPPGAIIVQDHISAERNLAAHGALLSSLLTDQPRREAMRQSLIRLGPADGAHRIARALLDLP